MVVLSVLVGVGAEVGFVGHGCDGGIVDGGFVLGADVFLIFSFSSSSSFEKTSKWLLLSSSSMGLGS